MKRHPADAWTLGWIAPMALGVVHGCTAIKSGSDRAPLIPAAALDAAIDPDAAPLCTHRTPPPKPNVTGSGGALDLVFAVSMSRYGTSSEDDAGRPAYLGYGFDLDDTCTGEGQGASCVEPAWATADHHDGVDGIDNSAAQLVSSIAPLSPDSSVATATAAEILFRVSDYSGGADDDQVKVSLYVAFGLDARPDGGGDGAGPLWDGQDRWRVLPDMLVPPGSADGGVPGYSVDQPLFHDDTAYVTGGVLVARIAQALWPTGLALAPTFLSPIDQLVVTGHLVQNGTAWELQDIVTGLRSPLQAILIGVSRTQQLSDATQPICQSMSLYEQVKQKVCAYADTSSGPDSLSSACDAVSGGSFLQAKQALLGDVAAPGPPLPACTPGVDPETDTCDSLVSSD